jgi:hypothetical protein
MNSCTLRTHAHPTGHSRASLMHIHTRSLYRHTPDELLAHARLHMQPRMARVMVLMAAPADCRRKCWVLWCRPRHARVWRHRRSTRPCRVRPLHAHLGGSARHRCSHWSRDGGACGSRLGSSGAGSKTLAAHFGLSFLFSSCVSALEYLRTRAGRVERSQIDIPSSLCACAVGCTWCATCSCILFDVCCLCAHDST